MFCVHKPLGVTSAACVGRIKAVLRKQFGKRIKVGHGGTLDKYAEGVLVIGVGRGCKELGTCLNGTKEYLVQGLLGVETDTFDRDGTVVRVGDASHITAADIEHVLPKYHGLIMQTPPPFSALKMGGQRYSDLNRSQNHTGPASRPVSSMDVRGAPRDRVPAVCQHSPQNQAAAPIVPPSRSVMCTHVSLLDVALPALPPSSSASLEVSSDDDDLRTMPQPVRYVPGNAHAETLRGSHPSTTILALPPGLSEGDIIEHALDQEDSVGKSASWPSLHSGSRVMTLHVSCGKGFYVRSLVNDIGRDLGCGAVMSELLRTRVGSFHLGQALKEGDWDLDSIMDALQASNIRIV